MNALLEPLPEAAQIHLRGKPRLAWAAHFVWKFVERYGEHQCPLFAGALAFFGLLSLFPITLAAVLILARFLAGNQQAILGLQNWVKGFFPGAAGNAMSLELAHVVAGLAGRSDPATLGILAIVPLLWSGRAYFDTLASVLNAAWPDTEPRSFWQHQLVLGSTFVGAGAMWLLSNVATFALSIARSLSAYLPNVLGAEMPYFWKVASYALGWLLTVVMFWMLYWFLPNRRSPQKRRVAIGAALLAALLWEAAKWLFSAFLGNLSRYETTYGSVAGVVLTLVWIYFSSLIILVCAEAAAAYEATQAAARTPDTDISHGTATEPEPDTA